MARLTADDWTLAAFERFNADGIAAVRVEAVARDLGTTKGSFYWHFADRAALVQTVLETWERTETEELIARVQQIESPRDRLAWLFEAIVQRMQDRGGERTLYIEAAAAGIHQVVGRVVERRVTYVAGVIEELGFDAVEARRRAALIVAAVIGYQQLIAGGWHPGAGMGDAALVASLLGMAVDLSPAPAAQHPVRDE
ncbi:hypothetical protein ASD65_06650 [Microbacterium sp. Root61]|uniref:TetR/AcrR family transcriptional regulator n=1 Tax=Microbacterium sp. Root61 TaxID=1736570 RepID=UPI0006FF62DF|nr:TetR/AcrR family transcriptional regulator [Microbacterium sp. Root61]KRA24140.1 hypothetical protein ASD65_06650 [Microbacterium sp. Root61]